MYKFAYTLFVGWAGGGAQVASYIPGGSKNSYNI